jgi:putative radical SAM enzyme (TIGR03279 family)
MRITEVEPGSDAEQAGIRVGDELIAVDGSAFEDEIDLTFKLAWTDEPEVSLELARGGDRYEAVLPAANPSELGFGVEDAPVRVCGNSCVFCFVDQLPRGLRSTLYVKDEDYRRSFTHGNYVTLTNLSDHDYERIATQRLSPLYVSVHATDDAVRREMLGTGEAPAILPSLRRLGDAGIRVHTQVVIVPGMNDGEMLERTLSDLFALGEMVESVAIVPVGLTCHREGLPALREVSATEAADALDAVERWQARFLAEGNGRTAYAADELYLLAGRELPPYEDYDDLPQLENGVGLLRSFEFELDESAGLLEDRVDPPLSVTLVTGKLAEGFIRSAVEKALGRVDGLTVRVVASENTLLGPTVTVAGLLPGADMAETLKGATESDLYLLPAVAFNEDGVTLDGMTVGDIAGLAARGNVEATDDLVGAVLNQAGGVPPEERS